MKKFVVPLALAAMLFLLLYVFPGIRPWGESVVPASPPPAPAPGANPAGAPESADVTGEDPAAALEEGRGTVTGTVVDPDGKPVARASVRARRHRRRDLLFFETVSGPGTTSGPDGLFTLALRPGAVCDLEAEAPDGRRGAVASVSAGASGVRILVGGGPRLVVVVTNRSGSPVAGARVLVLRAPARGTRRVVAGDAETDRVGRAVFDPFAPGVAGVLVSHPYLGSAPFFRQRVAARGDEVVEVVLGAGRDLVGRVVDDGTGKPIADARVGETPLFFRTERTEEDGGFVLRGVTNFQGEAERLFADADGYAAAGADIPEDGPVEIRLPRGRAVSGRVTDAQGRAVADALVEGFSWNRARREGYPRTARTREDGRFDLGPMRRDLGANRLRASAPGHGESTVQIEPAEGDMDRIDIGDIVLPPAGAIGGTVTDGDGAAIAGSLVRLARTTDEKTLPLEFAARTDREGRFLFVDLGPGRWRAEAENGGMAEIDLAAGRRVLDVLLAPPEGGTLAVRVVDDAGAPVPGARVSVLDAESRILDDAEADEAGGARFTGLPEGELSVSAWPPWSRRGYLPTNSDPVVADGREVVLTMERAPLLTGVVLDPEGEPLSGMRVMTLASADGMPLLGGLTDARGRFAVPVPAGEVVDVLVTGERMDPRAGVERLPFTARVADVRVPGEPLTIRTQVAASDRELLVRVLAPDGTPFVGAQVRAVSDAGQWMGPDGAETVRLAELPDREVEVRVLAHGSGYLAPEPVVVMPAGQEIVVRLRRGLPIVGVVRNAEGELAPGASVTVTADGRALAGAMTDEEGRFTVPGPEGTPVRLRAWAGSRRGAVEGVIAGGPPVEIVLGAH